MSNKHFAVHPGRSEDYRGWNPEQGVFILSDRKVAPGVALRAPNGRPTPPRKPIVDEQRRKSSWPPVGRRELMRKLGWLALTVGVFMLTVLLLASADADAILGLTT